MKPLSKILCGITLPVLLIAGLAEAKELKKIKYNDSCSAFYSEEKDKYRIFKVDCNESYSITNYDGDNQADQVCPFNGVCYNEADYNQKENSNSEYDLALKYAIFEKANELIGPNGEIVKAIFEKDLDEEVKKLQNSIIGNKPNKVDLKKIGDW